MAVARDTSQDDAQANGIMRYGLENGKLSRKQLAWLIGYVKRLQQRIQPQSKD